MKRFLCTGLAVVLFLSMTSVLAFAHVPYIERRDYSQEQPFVVTKSIEQSIAVYAWLEFENGYTDDIDVYTFELAGPTRVFVESLVPECPEYQDFLPWFAIVGPGLPLPEYSLPFPLPDGYGAVIVENYQLGEERPTFYEPFGNKNYYRGPGFDEILEEPGTYYVYFWDPYEMGGDYVAVLGDQEIWGFDDLIRALINTPLIRRDKELHVECNETIECKH